MNNFANEFLSHFDEQGITTIALTHSEYDSKINFFLSALKHKNHTIIKGDDIIEELSKVKNTTVFIEQPANLFQDNKKNDEEMEPWLVKNKYFEEIYSKSSKNNLSIIILSYLYKSSSKNNRSEITEIPNKLTLMSNLVINYKNGKIKILKNRWLTQNDFDIDLLRTFWIIEEREVKLKRVLKK